MKTTTYCLILFLFIFSESPAQTYHPFPIHQAYWNMDYTMPGPFGQIFHMERLYYLNGDTLVNNVVYHKMFQGDTSSGSTPTPPIALIREQNKQVLCRSYHVS